MGKSKILKVLEKVPSGTKLYSTAFGNLEFESIIEAWGNTRIDYFKANQNKWPKGITRWDCIFLFAEEFLNNAEVKQWQNIENIIFNVVSFALLPNDGSKSFQSNLHFKESCDGEIDKQKQFIQIVNIYIILNQINSMTHTLLLCQNQTFCQIHHNIIRVS